MTGMNLNTRAAELCTQGIQQADRLRITVSESDAGSKLVDCGVKAAGGLEAGRWLARICTAGLSDIELLQDVPEVYSGPAVSVATDHPTMACMAAQYAGWQLSADHFVAMGSGPMRAAAGREELFQQIGYNEQAPEVVGVLECGQLPPSELCVDIAAACRVPPENLTLLVARTSSIAGTVQIVARSIETAIHKLHELGFDLSRIQSGWGISPLPPVAENDLVGIGRTNDSILYGGRVTLWVTGDDASLESVGRLVPSCASQDFGQPFAQIFQRYDHDFYRIDPHLFSPAQITFHNLDSGNSYRFGEPKPDVLQRSFGMDG